MANLSVEATDWSHFPVTRVTPRQRDELIPARGVVFLSDWFDLQNSQTVFDQSQPSLPFSNSQGHKADGQGVARPIERPQKSSPIDRKPPAIAGCVSYA